MLSESDAIRISVCHDGNGDIAEELDDRLEFGHYGFNQAKAKAIEAFEREYLASLMTESHGNVTLAAKLAGKERRALGRLLKKYNIDKRDYF